MSNESTEEREPHIHRGRPYRNSECAGCVKRDAELRTLQGENADMRADNTRFRTALTLLFEELRERGDGSVGVAIERRARTIAEESL